MNETEGQMISPKEVLEHIEGRIKHPFIGSLTIGLFIHNWEILLTATTGTSSSAERISQINDILKAGSISQLFLWPVVFALLVTIVMPFGNFAINYFYNEIRLREKNQLSKQTDERDNTSENLYAKSVYVVDRVYSSISRVQNRLNEGPGAAQPYNFSRSCADELNKAMVDLSCCRKADHVDLKRTYHRLVAENKD